MKTYITKTDDEAKGLHDGTITLLVIPIDPQPGRVVWNSIIVRGVGGWTDEHGRKLACPYLPSDRVGVKETIAFRPGAETGSRKWRHYLLYMADKPDLEMQWHSYVRRSAPKMPLDAVRTRLLVKTAEARLVQDATPEQWRQFGFTPNALRDALEPLAAKVRRKDLHWIHGADEGGCWCWCCECAEKEVKRLVAAGADPKEVFVDGGWGGDDEDNNETCNGCGVYLTCFLTEYGVEQEVEHFAQYPIIGKDDAYCMWNVLDSDEANHLMLDPASENHNPKLYDAVTLIAARYLWDRRYPKLPWSANPWAWFYGMERTE